MPRRRTVEIKFKKLHKDAVIPQAAHTGDACMDITALSVEYDAEHDAYIYHTGLAGQTSGGKVALLFPRSSLYRKNYFMSNSVAVIDTDEYTGEWLVVFKCRDTIASRCMMEAMSEHMELMSDWKEQPWYIRLFSQKPASMKELYMKATREFWKDPLEYAPYKRGDRICQMMVLDLPQVNILKATSLRKTSRGTGGFGSTDKKKARTRKSNEDTERNN